MESYYILIVGFLFLLAFFLLIVGVSNDAVNFLNSAIGSKAASFSVILTIAAAGILIGAVFSNGMMEVARKGIFNPEYFSFNEIMVIFLSVMLTNILLLDFFNTLGLPTSTTISIVFGIMGAAVAVSLFKINNADDAFSKLSTYINIESSVMIIMGIFLSIIIAFNIGLITQWIVRLVFSFNVNATYKYLSGIWGGFAITAILYFLIIKGAKGSTLISSGMLTFIKSYSAKILLISFVGWSFLFQLLILFTRVNILKITVLAGTFALAMAFASNDLVNFIGVPLAGYESFISFVASGSSDTNGFLMESLHEPVDTPVIFLIAAGLIMVVTLRISKKAKTVTATTIDLSRQGEGSERFASSYMARIIVRWSIEVSKVVVMITPQSIIRVVRNRFDPELAKEAKQEKLAFDLVRASVNLVIASILIAIGTSLKLPLSTTYVTFMVAMGTSLADGAWGRDSAVYRITGVLTVIGGWFFTAFIAFFLSFLISTLIFFGKLPAILIIISLAGYLLLRSHVLHKKKSENSQRIEKEANNPYYETFNSIESEAISYIIRGSEIFGKTYGYIFNDRQKGWKNLIKESRYLINEINQINYDIPVTLRKYKQANLEISHYYIELMTYKKEVCNSLINIVQPALKLLYYQDIFDKDQTDKLKELNDQVSGLFSFAIELLQKGLYHNLEKLDLQLDESVKLTNEILCSWIKILNKTQKGIEVSMAYMEMLSETRNLLQNFVQFVRAEVKLLEAIKSDKEQLVKI